MRKYIFFLITILLLLPSFIFAKSPHPKGYEHAKGKEISVSQPVDWPIKIKSNTYVNVSIQSFSGMAVVQARPYNPWWRFFMKIPDSFAISVSGLPPSTDLHVYTHGYRNHEIKKTDASGTLAFTLSSKEDDQLIIKLKPSTKHIYIGGFINPAGGDCKTIGTWDAVAKTCTLNKDVTETISIEDSDITLDGAGKSVSFAGGDGIYTDESNVVIKNVMVQNSFRGVVYHDVLLTVADGGRVENAIVNNNTTNITDEGVSSLVVINSTIEQGTTGIYLYDQFDAFPTDNISITRVNFKGNTGDVFNDGTSFSLSNATDRGNFWDKNTGCTQDTSNPSHCTKGYIIDAGYLDGLPWACENGWTKTCPIAPPPPPPVTNTPTPTVSSPPIGGDWGEIVKGNPGATLYEAPDKSVLFKKLPNGWVVKITDESGLLWKVTDVSDDIEGWIDSAFLQKAANAIENDKLAAKASVDKDIKSARGGVIIDAVKHYAADTSTENNLYSGNNAKFGFNSFIADSKFPLDIIFTILGHEAPGSFDNSFVSFDYGHGITQTTMFPKSRDREYLRAFLIADGVVTTDAFPKEESVGYFGSITEQAVKDFQKKYSIDMVGVVGPTTRAKINSLISGDPIKYASVPKGFRFEDQLKLGSSDRTSSGEARGVISGLSIIPCSDLDNPISKNSHKNCYETKAGGGETKEYQPHVFYGGRTFKYYVNSVQGIYANIKDGIGILKNKYYAAPGNLVKDIAAKDPNKIWATSDTGIKINNDDMRILLAVRGYNGFGNDGCKKFNFVNTDNPDQANFYSKYLERVADSYLALNTEYETTTFPNYTSADPWYQKLYLAVKKKTEICIQSPAYLQITDAQNRFTGRKGNFVIHEIPQVVYDDESSKAASIIFPEGEYRYRLVGTEPDTYTVVFDQFLNSTTPIEFVAEKIPTMPGAVHEYVFDWKKLAAGGNGVAIKIDQNGDGVFERTIISDSTLTADEFGEGKVTICHIPPGNPSNAHTISIGKPALKAHLGHGDYVGECKSALNSMTSIPATASSLETKRIPPGQAKNKK